ncbi:MAG TPA: alpha/beta fold hydrolase [Kofleriaceae bacterium]|nr:alpha/beta fold hydrolase [Kofleriaceae bacterium]
MWHVACSTCRVLRLALRDVTLVVHDFGGPIALGLALKRPSIVRRVAVINSWMPLDDDPTVRRGARVAGSWFGKLLYRELALPLRVLMPQVYADRKKLTPEIHAQYQAPFASRASRAQVLWPLARSLLGSSTFHASLEASGHLVAEIPAAVIWGTRDRALGATQLAHWRRLLPHGAVTEIADAGHWPREEQPERVVAAIRDLVGEVVPR